MFVYRYFQVERARQQRQFRGLVVGPIGKFLKITNMKEHLASIAELALSGGTLDRFIVTNDIDRATLMGFRQSIGCSSFECGIFQIHDGPRYQIRSPPPSDKVETIATVLNITNDLVFNWYVLTIVMCFCFSLFFVSSTSNPKFWVYY